MKKTMNYIRGRANEALDLMERKSADYSKDNIAATGLHGIAVRLIDKVARLENLTKGNKTSPNNESIADTLQDISNYALIGQAVQDNQWGRSTQLVYLAGPIDDITERESKDWRRGVADFLKMKGVSCFNPAAAYSISLNNPPSSIIVELNKSAILKSDLVLVNLSGKGRAFGTIREIEFAVSKGIRVIIISDLSLSGHLAAHDVEIVESIDDACKRILINESTGDPFS